MIYKEKDLTDALALEKPGRMLPLDDDDTLSADGVARVIHAIKTLAFFYRGALADLRVMTRQYEVANEEWNSLLKQREYLAAQLELSQARVLELQRRDGIILVKCDSCTAKEPAIRGDLSKEK